MLGECFPLPKHAISMKFYGVVGCVEPSTIFGTQMEFYRVAGCVKPSVIFGTRMERHIGKCLEITFRLIAEVTFIRVFEIPSRFTDEMS